MGNYARRECLNKSLRVIGRKSISVLDFGSGRGVNYDILLPIVKVLYSLEPDRIAWVE